MARCRMSFTRVDFPEPDTPVTTVSNPTGNGTSMFFRLLARAPRTVSNFPLAARRLAGTGMLNSPERYLPGQ